MKFLLDDIDLFAAASENPAIPLFKNIESFNDTTIHLDDIKLLTVLAMNQDNAKAMKHIALDSKKGKTPHNTPVEQPTHQSANKTTAQPDVQRASESTRTQSNSAFEKPNHSIYWSRDFFVATLGHFAEMVTEEDGILQLQIHQEDVLSAQKNDPESIRPGYAELLAVAPEALNQYAQYASGDHSTPLTDMLADDNTMIDINAYVASIHEDAAENNRSLKMDEEEDLPSAFASNGTGITYGPEMTRTMGRGRNRIAEELEEQRKKQEKEDKEKEKEKEKNQEYAKTNAAI